MKNTILSTQRNTFLEEKGAVIYQDLILRYIYQETSPKENKKVEKLLQEKESFKQFFYEIVSLKKQMDKCQTRYKPSNQIIEKILSYAKK